MVFVRIWRYDVADDQQAEFERVYGPDGDWARLFAASDGFMGTELYVRLGETGRYLTVDRFTSLAAWESFRTEHSTSYAELDLATERLRLTEDELGTGDDG
jgi:heme-degrading monooxygenase HmoA